MIHKLLGKKFYSLQKPPLLWRLSSRVEGKLSEVAYRLSYTKFLDVNMNKAVGAVFFLSVIGATVIFRTKF